MEIKCFIGLILKSNSPSAKKIDEYRFRFDPKAYTNKYLHMSLLPPFVLTEKQLKNLTHDILDEVDTYFTQDHKTEVGDNNLLFPRVDVYNNRRKILYLEPYLPTDLVYLKEGLEQLLFDLIPEYKRRHIKEKCFLSLGRFQDPLLLNLALDTVLDEFVFPLEFEIDQLALFSRRDGIWNIHRTLYDFKEAVNPFLEEKIYF